MLANFAALRIIFDFLQEEIFSSTRAACFDELAGMEEESLFYLINKHGGVKKTS